MTTREPTESELQAAIADALRQAVRRGGYSRPELCSIEAVPTAVYCALRSRGYLKSDGTLTEAGFREGCRLNG